MNKQRTNVTAAPSPPPGYHDRIPLWVVRASDFALSTRR